MNFFKHRYLFSDAGAGAGGAAGGQGGGQQGGQQGGGQQGGGLGGGQQGGGQQGGGQQGGGQSGGQGGGENKPWYSAHNFDADTVAWIEERKFEDLASTIKAGREGSKLARDRNVMPKPDPANLNDWSGWTDLGWTADAAKYQIEPPKLNEGDVHDQAAFDVFKRVAHEQHLSPAQAAAIYNVMHENSNKGIRAIKLAGAAENQKLEKGLREAWGADYDTNATLARRAFSFFGKGDFSATDLDAAMGSPRTVKLFHAIGAAMGEDKLVDPLGGQGVGGTETVAGLQAQLNQLLADPDFKKAFGDPRHPQHADYKARRQSLMERKANLEIKARKG